MSLQVEDLRFSYRGWQVLKGVSFCLKQGNLVCILGKNGAGKSTLFRCILSMLSNYKGTILVNKKNIKQCTIQELADSIAYIPQVHSAVYNFSVIDMVLMGTTASMGTFKTPGKKEYKRALEALQMAHIEYLEHRTFGHISGGEQQMVLIARAIAQQARILIMDEPCSSLDYGNQIRIMEMTKRLAEQGYLILQSTHNPEHALLYADQVMVLDEGVIRQFGEPNEVLTEDVLGHIYGIDISLCDIGWDNRKVCIPSQEAKMKGEEQ
ncbi:ABC transporter ATP-binding protein [Lachnospiraceae bacterium LCP25S3_G4]